MTTFKGPSIFFFCFAFFLYSNFVFAANEIPERDSFTKLLEELKATKAVDPVSVLNQRTPPTNTPTQVNPVTSNQNSPQQSSNPSSMMSSFSPFLQMLQGMLKGGGGQGDQSGGNPGSNPGGNKGGNPGYTPPPSGDPPPARRTETPEEPAATPPEPEAKPTTPTETTGTHIVCNGKKLIVVGIEGTPSGKHPDPSPGIKKITAMYKGKVFKSPNEGTSAAERARLNDAIRDYLLAQTKGKRKDEYSVIFIGHSSGANMALRQAEENKLKYPIGSVIAADVAPGSAAAYKNGVPNTIMLKSFAPFYAGSTLPPGAGKTVPYAVNHYRSPGKENGIDDKILNHMPCKSDVAPTS